MEPFESMLAELRSIGEEYQKLIDERVRLLDAGDFEALKRQNAGISGKKGFFPEEIALTKRSNKLKDKLHKMFPEEFLPSNNGGRRWNDGGKRQRLDNGFFKCQKCSGLFDYIDNKHEVTTISHDTFSSCKDHSDRKRVGTLEALIVL